MSSANPKPNGTLDPVTFEVLRNSFVTIVDQMAEQVRRTCYSFVIYNRDFSNALCDAEGNTVAQGHQDLAAHVGTLHYTCKAVIEDFAGDIHPGDVFLVNDPWQVLPWQYPIAVIDHIHHPYVVYRQSDSWFPHAAWHSMPL